MQLRVIYYNNNHNNGDNTAVRPAFPCVLRAPSTCFSVYKSSHYCLPSCVCVCVCVSLCGSTDNKKTYVQVRVCVNINVSKDALTIVISNNVGPQVYLFA